MGSLTERLEEQLGSSGALVADVAVAVIALCFLIWISSKLLRLLTSRSLDHAEWAHGIKFSTKELTVLRTLWQWQKTGHAPTGTTLSLLSPGEMAALISKVGLDNMPPHLRAPNEEKKRAGLVLKYENIGMDPVEAEITAGMISGRLGPANVL